MGLFSRVTPRIQRILGASVAGLAITGVAALGGGASQPAPITAPVSPAVPNSQSAPAGLARSASSFTTADGKTVTFKAPGLGGKEASFVQDREEALLARRAAVKPAAKPKVPRVSAPKLGLSGMKQGSTYMDISEWQGNVDFHALHRAGVRQVMMRASYGTLTDVKVEQYYRGAVKAGIQPSLYTWVVPGESPTAQANALVHLRNSLMKKYPGKAPPRLMFDVEDNKNGRAMSAAQHSKALLQEVLAVAKATGQKPSSMLLYTGSWVWDPTYGSAKFGPSGLNMIVVDANYNYRPGAPLNSIPWPKGLGRPDVVQYSSTSHYPGIAGNVDKNVVTSRDFMS